MGSFLDHPRHQAELVGAMGADGLAEQDQVRRSKVPDRAWQQQRAAGFGSQSERDERVAEPGGRIGDDHVAVRQRGGSHAYHHPVHGGDQRNREAGKSTHEAQGREVLPRGWVGEEFVQVVARTEPGTGAGKEKHLNSEE